MILDAKKDNAVNDWVNINIYKRHININIYTHDININIYKRHININIYKRHININIYKRHINIYTQKFNALNEACCVRWNFTIVSWSQLKGTIFLCQGWLYKLVLLLTLPH